jgi:hypothetical protein
VILIGYFLVTGWSEKTVAKIEKSGLVPLLLEILSWETKRIFLWVVILFGYFLDILWIVFLIGWYRFA